ncbi:MAG: sigma 54-interacting transcriptional regulator, partial [Paramuribaculum sp.]|nr:sigma 54-interacting transcriptional regulator [Paramuribaculum sp.]
IAVICGAIPEGTIDSELFGHEKGAFTGAVATRKGYFEEADGGTIFLDEVAELPLTTQARLLRVLETGEFIKVGSSTVQKTNIRVVAATNVDLLKAVEMGRFREDLFYRLSTVHISIPPLRDRGNDITLLARKFAADFAERYRTPQISFDEEAKQLLLHYRWPGNVRQLKNVTDQIALFNAGQTVGTKELMQYLPPSSGVYTPAVATSHNAHDYERERELLFNMLFKLQNEIDSLRKEIKGDHPVIDNMPKSLVKYSPAVDPIILTPERQEVETMPATLEETEKETIRRSLENNGGRRKATAKELNISERTLYRKIKEYGLE